MTIEEKDFKLIPVSTSGNKFDLEVLYTVNKGKSNERQEFKNIAYGISIDTAIHYIINYRIGEKHPENALTLKQYLQEYKDNLTEIKTLCQV